MYKKKLIYFVYFYAFAHGHKRTVWTLICGSKDNIRITSNCLLVLQIIRKHFILHWYVLGKGFPLTIGVTHMHTYVYVYAQVYVSPWRLEQFNMLIFVNMYHVAKFSDMVYPFWFTDQWHCCLHWLTHKM